MLLVVALLAWPAVEIFVMIEIAYAIGVLAMVLLLIASWPIGVWVMRSRGRVAWRRLADALIAGRLPGHEVLDGALVLLGGALFLVPGFIADALGTLVLLPPARRALRSLVVRNLRNKLLVDVARFTRTRTADDVDSTAREVDRPKLPR
jgi:UPF0716 protein FxsA